MFTIFNGGEYFFQWDLGQRLIVNDEAVTKVHFCNQSEADCSLVVEVYEENGKHYANVPNILLQDTRNIRVYGIIEDGSTVCGKHYQIFRVIAKGKPEEYVYTETEVLNYNTLLERVENLEKNGGGGGGGSDLTGYATEEYVQEYLNTALLGGKW